MEQRSVVQDEQPVLSVEQLRTYMAGKKTAEAAQEQGFKKAQEAAKQHYIEQLDSFEITEANIARAMARIREAAQRGECELMLLRFPSDMCTDSGRAINNALPGWEHTLASLPLRVYEVWQKRFRDLGYHFAARVLDYPGGMPGDTGIFFTWKE